MWLNAQSWNPDRSSTHSSCLVRKLCTCTRKSRQLSSHLNRWSRLVNEEKLTLVCMIFHPWKKSSMLRWIIWLLILMTSGSVATGLAHSKLINWPDQIIIRRALVRHIVPELACSFRSVETVFLLWRRHVKALYHKDFTSREIVYWTLSTLKSTSAPKGKVSSKEGSLNSGGRGESNDYP